MTTTINIPIPTFLEPAFNLVCTLLTDQKYFSLVAGLVVLGDAFLTQLIILFVPYTEIDWETYMYQLELYLNGERDYSLISGPTGPIVYPAGHVYIHQLLYKLTESGRSIFEAQEIYGLLYIVSLVLTIAIYRQAGNVPNWVLVVLPLSKRLHSIFVLRLFNDCWSVVATQAAVLAYGHSWNILGTLLYGAALSIKMNALLLLPGLLVVLFRKKGLLATLQHVALIALTQVAIGLPFLLHHPRSYLKNSYDFSRVFLFKWTVNWRFLQEEWFLHPNFAKLLLVGHVFALVMYGLFRWCRSEGGTIALLVRGFRHPTRSPALKPVTADYTTTVLFTSNMIGMMFARSLHYQFYSWYAHQLPFLLSRSKHDAQTQLMILVLFEVVWNTYPATRWSSSLLWSLHSAMLAAIWFGYYEGKDADEKQVSIVKLDKKDD